MTTVSFTRDDIVKRNPVDIWQMLRGVPSIDIEQTQHRRGAVVAFAPSDPGR